MINLHDLDIKYINNNFWIKFLLSWCMGSMVPVQEPNSVVTSVAYGEVPFPHRKLVLALAWRTGSMLPVWEANPVGWRGTQEGYLPVRETCFCDGLVYKKHASCVGKCP